MRLEKPLGCFYNKQLLPENSIFGSKQFLNMFCPSHLAFSFYWKKVTFVFSQPFFPRNQTNWIGFNDADGSAWTSGDSLQTDNTTIWWEKSSGYTGWYFDRNFSQTLPNSLKCERTYVLVHQNIFFLNNHQFYFFISNNT